MTKPKLNKKIEYYTYVYLDPLIKGPFSYGEYTFEYEPFYVGCGKNNRMYSHLIECEKNKHKSNIGNMYKNYRIKKILSNHIKPVIIKITTSFSDKEILRKEQYIIKTIGRKDLGLGPLLNLTDGGVGTINPSNTTKIKISKSVKKAIKEGRITMPDNTGNIPWNKGLTDCYTTETRNQISTTLSDAWKEGKLKYTKKFCTDRSNEYKRRFASGELKPAAKGKPSWNRIILNGRIHQYDLNHILIYTWNNSDEIRKNITIEFSKILNCIRGKQQKAGGFIWQLEDVL
jgi:hypothetical protein